MDIAETTAPRSDQQNFDDYLNGPRTVTVAEVRRGTDEQPVEIHLIEFPGRPYKPSKSMRRVLVAAWGADSSAYIGRRMKLVGDPTVKFGPATVGGIKIAQLSDLDKRLTIALTVSKGKRQPYVVEPLTAAPAAAPVEPRPFAPMHQLAAAFAAVGITDKADRLHYCREIVGRDITSATDLTPAEIVQVVDSLAFVNQDEGFV